MRSAKEAYTAAINRRSASQREVNELLQRKHAWSPTDLERFTSLYRSDHANEQDEVAAQERLTKAERTADEAQSVLTKSILVRYHEEQIWSDKIRSASTWVTWALMGFNVFLFIIVQLGLEPWRRRRLVRGFEEKVREAMQEETLRGALLRLEVERQGLEGKTAVAAAEAEAKEEVLVHTATVEEPAVTEEVPAEELPVVDENEGEILVPETEVPVVTEGEVLLEPAEEELDVVEEPLLENYPELTPTPTLTLGEKLTYQTNLYRDSVASLFSDQQVSIRRRDLTNVALEGAAAGAIITGVITFLWNR